MSVKIVIVGSTGKLGTKLLNFTNKYSISIYGITCYRNYKKLNNQKNNYNINKSFVLNNSVERFKFLKLLEEKIHILYFLDYGSLSLSYLDHFLKNLKACILLIIVN